MMRVGFVGWRGMVGSVLMQRMRGERDFETIEPVFFSTSSAGAKAPNVGRPAGVLRDANDVAAFRELDANAKGLYEPIHGSAPDIAGQDRANPLATILSLAMMFRHTFAREDVAQRIEQAVRAALHEGLRTPDIAATGERVVGTRRMGEAVAAALRNA